MRLIDAGALIAEMHNVILEDGDDRSIFYEVIERQPTIDPVKHGRWTYKAARARSVYFIQHVQCNVCGHIRPRLTGDILRYCPHCGARMDEVTE